MKTKILVVDDDKDIVLAIETILRMEGYDVIHAYTGEESLSLIKTEQPTLMLLDFMLPDMTGKEVIEIIRKDNTIDNFPIILISAAHSVKEMSQHIPIQGLIEKPFELDQLLSTVAKFARTS